MCLSIRHTSKRCFACFWILIMSDWMWKIILYRDHDSGFMTTLRAIRKLWHAVVHTAIIALVLSDIIKWVLWILNSVKMKFKSLSFKCFEVISWLCNKFKWQFVPYILPDWFIRPSNCIVAFHTAVDLGTWTALLERRLIELKLHWFWQKRSCKMFHNFLYGATKCLLLIPWFIAGSGSCPNTFRWSCASRTLNNTFLWSCCLKLDREFHVTVRHER